MARLMVAISMTCGVFPTKAVRPAMRERTCLDQIVQMVYKGAYRFRHVFVNNVVFYVSAHDDVYSLLLCSLVTNDLFNGDRLERIAVWMDSLTLFSTPWMCPCQALPV